MNAPDISEIRIRWQWERAPTALSFACACSKMSRITERTGHYEGRRISAAEMSNLLLIKEER
jgi:hypothetical protein